MGQDILLPQLRVRYGTRLEAHGPHPRGLILQARSPDPLIDGIPMDDLQQSVYILGVHADVDDLAQRWNISLPAIGKCVSDVQGTSLAFESKRSQLPVVLRSCEITARRMAASISTVAGCCRDPVDESIFAELDTRHGRELPGEHVIRMVSQHGNAQGFGTVCRVPVLGLVEMIILVAYHQVDVRGILPVSIDQKVIVRDNP